MDRAIDLLRKKNHFLEKFLLVSEAELLNFESGDYDNIESFYECREKILNIIKHIEKDFEMTFQQFDDDLTTENVLREEVQNIYKKKEELVGRILDLDLKLLSCIDTAKSEIIKELRNIKEGQKVLDGYRAPTESRRALNEEV